MMGTSPDEPDDGRRSFTTKVEWTALAISVAASLLLVGRVMYQCRSGFDLTDEGFYLNWISNPWNSGASVSQFGFVYHPLYRLVGGDVALLRQANVLITYALSCSLCVIWIRSLCLNWTGRRPLQRAGFVGIAVVLASASLAFFDSWLTTPNYNSLNLQSLMIATIGALLAGHTLSRSSIAGWILIGIGGGFAFLAKPTTAAMLGLLIAFGIIGAGKFSLRGLLLSVATAILLLVISALAIDGSLSDFVRRFTKGLALADQLLPSGGPSTFFRWDSFDLSRAQRTIFFVVLFSSGAVTALAFLRDSRAHLCAALATALLAALSVAAVAGAVPLRISADLFVLMQFLAIPLGILLATTVLTAGAYRRLSRGSLTLILVLTALPYAYAFGTNNNLWSSASHAALFWVLAGFVVWVELAATDGAWRKLLPTAAITLLMTSMIVAAAMEGPYRQIRPLRLQTDAVEINPRGSRLFLAEEGASYLRDLRRLADDNGFRAGDPVIDLTGASPGSLYALGAHPMGAAWTLGGYPGSDDFLAMALGQETCASIGASWILTETNSRDALSASVLERFGIHLSRDHLDVGSIKSVRAYAPKAYEHRLLKPARPFETARLACEGSRQTK
jgi:hypothetical protein